MNANLLYMATKNALRREESQRINLLFLIVIVTSWCNHAPLMKQIANKRDKTKLIVPPELDAHYIQYDLLLYTESSYLTHASTWLGNARYPTHNNTGNLPVLETLIHQKQKEYRG